MNTPSPIPKNLTPEQECAFFKQECRNNLLMCVQACDPTYIVSKVHVLLADKLQQVAEGKCKRLIISTPPRIGKSRLACIEFPAWALGRNPKEEIVVASYAQSLSLAHSRGTRTRMSDQVYQNLFETRITDGDSQVHDWGTPEGGRYKATGVGGGLTGRGASIILADDLIKDFAEAHSTTVLQNVWDWLWSVAYTRLTPNGAIVLIGTRWSVGDPIGRVTDTNYQSTLVDSGVGDKWDVINLPALADVNDPLGRELGESIFPERFTKERLLQTRAAVGSYVWSALYCGNPVIRGGNYIPVTNFQVIEAGEVPANLHWVRAWDLAASEKKSADFTAGIRGAIDADGNLYLRDGIRGQWAWPTSRERIIQTARLEPFTPVGIEAVAGFKTAYQNLWEIMPKNVMLREIFTGTDKLTRALEWIALVERKKVFLVRGDWVMNFLQEAAAFPDPGTHDDVIDAVSLIWTMLRTYVSIRPMPSIRGVTNSNRRSRQLAG